MDEYPGEIMIIGSSSSGERVYLLQTLYIAEEDAFKASLKYVELNDKGKWSELKDLQIPGFDIGERFAHLYMNQTEDVFFLSIAENVNSENEDLFVSLKDEKGNWSAFIDLGPTINTQRAELSPFLSADKKTLFFSSEGHGSYGATDVFVSYRLDDSWTKWTRPKNLGESVNSEFFDENFILLSNGDYYFTSNREEDVADIYTTHSAGNVEMKKGRALALEWNGPANPKLGIKENAVYEHVQVADNGSFSFLVKSKIDKVKFEVESYSGEKPLFIYKLADDDTKLSRSIFKTNGERWTPRSQKIFAKLYCNGNVVQNGTVYIYDSNGYQLGEIQSDDQGVVTIATDSIDRLLSYRTEEGNCRLRDIRLVENGSLIGLLAEYGAIIDKDKLKSDVAVKTVKSSAGSEDVEGAAMKLYFDFNSVSLSAQEEQKLIEFANKLKQDPTHKIMLFGFTDDVGTDEVNLEIGEERAAYVRKILLDAGVPASQIQSKSLGESMPAATNDNESGRAKNRRVEIGLEP